MNNQIRLKIGDFSQLMHVTIRTLRHYEQIGLLKPYEVDEWTGYRYYKVEQMHALNNILRFKEVGFSLEEIKCMLEEETSHPDKSLLEKKIAECEEELHRLTLRKEQLQIMLNRETKMESIQRFSIQSIPAMIVASYSTKLAGSSEMKKLCNEIISPELQRLGCKRIPNNACSMVLHDTEFHETYQEIEYCEEVVEQMEDSCLIKFKQLPEIPQALCMAVWGGYEQLPLTFPELYSYIERNGYQIIGDTRMCFVNGCWNETDSSKWLTILQIPIGHDL